MCTYVHVLRCVLFAWYLLCSRKANFYVIHRQWRFCILYCCCCFEVNTEIPHRYRKSLTVLKCYVGSFCSSITSEIFFNLFIGGTKSVKERSLPHHTPLNGCCFGLSWNNTYNVFLIRQHVSTTCQMSSHMCIRVSDMTTRGTGKGCWENERQREIYNNKTLRVFQAYIRLQAWKSGCELRQYKPIITQPTRAAWSDRTAGEIGKRKSEWWTRLATCRLLYHLETRQRKECCHHAGFQKPSVPPSETRQGGTLGP